MSRTKEGKANREIVLQAMPGTQADIVKATGLSCAVVSRWCRELVEVKQAHVGAWHKMDQGGPLRAVYHAGDGKRARKRLERVSDAERMRLHRWRQRQSGEYEDVLAKRRAKRAAQRVPKPDPLAVALFGGA